MLILRNLVYRPADVNKNKGVAETAPLRMLLTSCCWCTDTVYCNYHGCYCYSSVSQSVIFVPQEAVWKHINGTHDDLFVTKQDVMLTKSDLNNLTAEAQESVNEVH